MKNTIKVNDTTIKGNEYVVVSSVGDKMEMLTNLEPDNLLLFLMPILIELDKKFNLIDKVPKYCN